MESLFDMQRFDPDAENVKEVTLKGYANHENLNYTLKRKLASAGDEVDIIGKAEVKDGEKKGDEDDPLPKKKKKNKKKTADIENIEGFTILGDFTDQSKVKVNRVLPYWLSHPDIVTVDLHSSPLPVTDMPGLDTKLVAKMAKENIHHFFPVQRQVIPHLLQASPKFRPSDVCVSAPTGSGKTLAFVLPIISALRSRMVPRVRVVAVLPTQELASQVYSVFLSFTEATKLRVKLLTGGTSSVGEGGLVRPGIGGQVHQLYDILVATPGRLTQTIKECPNLDLTYLRYLVIDEADRMMENIAQDWLNILEAAVYRGKRTRPGLLTAKSAHTPAIPLQKLLFSATLSQDPEQLEQLNLFEPKLYRCVVPVAGLTDTETAQSLPTSLAHKYSVVSLSDKPLAVHHILSEAGLERVLVFTHSNDNVHRLAMVLANLGHKTGELHSKVTRRKKVLSGLSKGVYTVVVCSDVVARGIDLEDLDAVISYDAPSYVKTYIHRVGRTARAGRPGTAYTLCDEKQAKPFLKMLRDGNVTGCEEKSITSDHLDPLREDYKKSLEKVQEQLHQEKVDQSARSSDKQKNNKFFRKKK